MNYIDLILALENRLIRNAQQEQRILINGKWGIGKSFCWNEFTKKTEEINLEKRETEEKKIKTLKVSLFGVSSLDALERKIKTSYLKADTKIGRVVNTALTSIGKKYLGDNIDPINFVSIPKNYIICFDDLERKSVELSIQDIMGFIEEVALDSKVIIIINEEALQETDKKDYLVYKEKIIDSDLILNEISDEVYNVLLSDLFLNPNQLAIIKYLFQKHGDSNLRTLSKIKRLIGNLQQKLSTLDDELIKLCTAVIIEELKNPNKEINSILKYHPYDISLRVIGLESVILQFLKENKLDTIRIKEYLFPPANSKIISLVDIFNNIYMYSEQILSIKFEEAVGFLVNKEGPIVSLHNLLLLVGHLKTLSRDYTIDLDVDILNKITISSKEHIDSFIPQYNNDALLKQQLRIRDNHLSLSRDISSEVVELVDYIGERITFELRNRQLFFIDESFGKQDYLSCFSELEKNPKLIIERLHFYDDLVETPAPNYFQLLRRFTEDSLPLVDIEIRKTVKIRLEKILENISDRIVLKRITLLLESF